VVLFAVKISTEVDMPWWGIFLPLLIQSAFLIAVTVVGNSQGINMI
jgi:hypothetical protein